MPRDHRLDFGIHIGYRRENDLGLTGTAVAAACQVTQSRYSDWERSKSLPKTEQQVRALAQALQFDPDWLVTLWSKTKADVDKKGPAKVTSAYAVTSGEGRDYSDEYTR